VSGGVSRRKCEKKEEKEEKKRKGSRKYFPIKAPDK